MKGGYSDNATDLVERGSGGSMVSWRDIAERTRRSKPETGEGQGDDERKSGGPKPTHRLAPAVRQDTKNRLWRPKESETTNDIKAGSRQATVGLKFQWKRKKGRKGKQKRKKNKKRKKRKGKRGKREETKTINGKAPGKVSDRPEGASAGGTTRELQYHYRLRIQIQRQDIGIDH